MIFLFVYVLSIYQVMGKNCFCKDQNNEKDCVQLEYCKFENSKCQSKLCSDYSANQCMSHEIEIDTGKTWELCFVRNQRCETYNLTCIFRDNSSCQMDHRCIFNEVQDKCLNSLKCNSQKETCESRYEEIESRVYLELCDRMNKEECMEISLNQLDQESCLEKTKNFYKWNTQNQCEACGNEESPQLCHCKDIQDKSQCNRLKKCFFEENDSSDQPYCRLRKCKDFKKEGQCQDQIVYVVEPDQELRDYFRYFDKQQICYWDNDCKEVHYSSYNLNCDTINIKEFCDVRKYCEYDEDEEVCKWTSCENRQEKECMGFDSNTKTKICQYDVESKVCQAVAASEENCAKSNDFDYIWKDELCQACEFGEKNAGGRSSLGIGILILLSLIR